MKADSAGVVAPSSCGEQLPVIVPRIVDPWLAVGGFEMGLHHLTIQLPDGGTEESDYAVVLRSPTVVVIAQRDNGEICVLRQYRYPTNSWVVEFPGGGIDVDPELDPELDPQPVFDEGNRETQEEAGISASRFRYVGWMYPEPGLTNERCYIVVARGLAAHERSHLPTEFIGPPQWVTPEYALERVVRNEWPHAKLGLALMRAMFSGVLVDPQW